MVFAVKKGLSWFIISEWASLQTTIPLFIFCLLCVRSDKQIIKLISTHKKLSFLRLRQKWDGIISFKKLISIKRFCNQSGISPSGAIWKQLIWHIVEKVKSRKERCIWTLPIELHCLMILVVLEELFDKSPQTSVTEIFILGCLFLFLFFDGGQ